MDNQEIIQKLDQAGFYGVYELFARTGIWSSTAPYGAMKEVYKDLTGKKLDTGCSGCVQSASELIFKTYPKI